MAVSAVGAADSSLNKSGVNIQDFLKILTSELTNQDPLKPMDNEQFVAQLAQFTTLQEAQQSNQKLDSLLSVQSATQSIGLIGKAVDVQMDSGVLRGTVTSLAFVSGEPRFSVAFNNGSTVDDITLSSVVGVH